MIDPSDAMNSFQFGISHGSIKPIPGVIHSDIFVFYDEPQGKSRLTYVSLEKNIVTAFVNFVQHEPVDGIPCFQIGYAVPFEYRNQGRAKELICKAMSEMRHGFKNTHLVTFYVEAIVSQDNFQSQKVAANTLSEFPERITDEVSGLPALQYLKKIE